MGADSPVIHLALTSHLQPAELAAVPAPHRDRQSALAETGGDHRGQVQFRPSVAPRAVGREVVAVLEQAGEGAGADYRSSVTRIGVPVPGRATRAAASGFLTYSGAARQRRTQLKQVSA